MQNLTRIGIALLLIVAGSLAWYFDLFDYLSIERLWEAKATLGIWAPIAFVVAFMIGGLSYFWDAQVFASDLKIDLHQVTASRY